MKKFAKIAFSVTFFVLVFLILFGISAFSNFYNDLNYVGLGKYVLQEFFVTFLAVFILVVFPFGLFFVRTRLSISLYSRVTELSGRHSIAFLVVDLVVTAVILVFVLLNLREIHAFLTLLPSFDQMSNVYDYPFVLGVGKFLLTYILFVFGYTLAPILYLSHKSCSVRFVGLSILPHRVSLLLVLIVVAFLVYLAFFVISYSVILSLEDLQRYSFVFTYGSLVSVILLLYSFLVLVRFVGRLPVPWYVNLGVFAFLVGFVVLTSLYRFLPTDFYILKLETLEEVGKRQFLSKFVLRVDKVDVSSAFEKVDVSSIDSLRGIVVEDREFAIKQEAVVEVIREARFLERFYILLTSGKIDYAFKGGLVVTNRLNLGRIFKFSSPWVFSFSSAVGETNSFEVSVPYEFGGKDFFYRKYFVFWTSGENVTVVDLRGDGAGDMVKGYLTSKDYYLLYEKMRVFNEPYRMVLVKTVGEYYVVAMVGKSILLSNESCTVFRVSSYNPDEMFLFLGGIPLFVSNIYFENRVVGVKVRYFDVEGRGFGIQEGISNLIGNALYYYKVVELTNRIESLMRYVEDNKDRIPPDVVEKLRLFLSR